MHDATGPQPASRQDATAFSAQLPASGSSTQATHALSGFVVPAPQSELLQVAIVLQSPGVLHAQARAAMKSFCAAAGSSAAQQA